MQQGEYQNDEIVPSGLRFSFGTDEFLAVERRAFARRDEYVRAPERRI